jgi:hypothetical protein
MGPFPTHYRWVTMVEMVPGQVFEGVVATLPYGPMIL